MHESILYCSIETVKFLMPCVQCPSLIKHLYKKFYTSVRVFNERCSVLVLLGVSCSRPIAVYLSPYTSSLTLSYRRLTAPDNGLCPHVVSCCPRKTVYVSKKAIHKVESEEKCHVFMKKKMFLMI